ncbi:hypothetical protein [Lysinibacillus pakistanensis]|uniref:Uncharacterized protein n=1 Tax=Lysinibacillus pakistanensis TaxID=759811 RepID=A0AAX3WUX0_9BACI|nr:hypothetical protein [Lysinibacillus pakistanensis]MDM5231096.1 hypothetical protein [Lysinibacillus pakistanensis]WHY46655.1 hypothetical protein QNH22_26090 [Lysinibacillus pakistanensis]WHY51668.1 hypothetical protein QNH24_26050 [Lysinibacillus pakistanensis]
MKYTKWASIYGTPIFIFIQQMFFISKALQQRQIQQTPTSIGDEINANLVSFQWVSKHLLNEDKASGGCHGFSKE